MYSNTLLELGQWQQEQERMIRMEEERAKRELTKLRQDRATIEEYLQDPGLSPTDRAEYERVLQDIIQSIDYLQNVRAKLTERFKQEHAAAITSSAAQYQARQTQERARGKERAEFSKQVLRQLGQRPRGMRGFVQALIARRKGRYA